jgi:hypothetical protein
MDQAITVGEVIWVLVGIGGIFAVIGALIWFLTSLDFSK